MNVQKNDESINELDSIRQAFCSDEHPESRRRMQDSLQRFRKDLHQHPYVRRRHRRAWCPSGIHLLAGSGAVLACLIIGVVLLPTGSDSVTWAEVGKELSRVRSFQATLYFKKNHKSPTMQYEFWAGAEGAVRVHHGTQVIFARRGQIVRAFDVEKRKEVTPDRMVKAIVDRFGPTDQWSLDQLLILTSGRRLVDMTAVVNQDQSISEDVVVFDVSAEDEMGVGRVWALRNSKLPIRFKSFPLHYGSSMDMAITYAREQPAEFFDADAYGRRLKDRSLTKAEMQNLHRKDAGRKGVNPPRLNPSKVHQINVQTAEGDSWSLNEYSGKTVLISCKSGDRYCRGRLDVNTLRKMHEKYGRREDFAMMTLFIGSKDAARRFVNEERIKWPVVVESNGWDGPLAKVLGAKPNGQIYWIAWKNGHVGQFHVLDSRDVDAAVIGITPSTLSGVGAALRHCRTPADVISICGEPDKITKRDFGEIWYYERVDKEKQEAVGFSVTLRPGKPVSFGYSRSYLDWAELRVSISPERWKKIYRQVDPSIIKRLDEKKKHVIHAAPAGSKGLVGCYIIGAGHPFVPIEPGKTYPSKLHAGRYDLYLVFLNNGQLYSHSPGHRVLLKSDVDLAKHKITVVAIE